MAPVIFHESMSLRQGIGILRALASVALLSKAYNARVKSRFALEKSDIRLFYFAVIASSLVNYPGGPLPSRVAEESPILVRRTPEARIETLLLTKVRF